MSYFFSQAQGSGLYDLTQAHTHFRCWTVHSCIFVLYLLTSNSLPLLATCYIKSPLSKSVSPFPSSHSHASITVAQYLYEISIQQILIWTSLCLVLFQQGNKHSTCVTESAIRLRHISAKTCHFSFNWWVLTSSAAVRHPVEGLWSHGTYQGKATSREGQRSLGRAWSTSLVRSIWGS